MKAKSYLIAGLLLAQQIMIPLALAGGFAPEDKSGTSVTQDDKTGKVTETKTDKDGKTTSKETWERDKNGNVTHKKEDENSKSTETTPPPPSQGWTPKMDTSKDPAVPIKTSDGKEVGSETKTKPDGTSTTQSRDENGKETTTVTKPDGSYKTTEVEKDGTVTTTTGRKDARGKEMGKQTKIVVPKKPKKQKKTETEFDENGDPKKSQDSSRRDEKDSWTVDKTEEKKPKQPKKDNGDSSFDGDSGTLTGTVVAVPETVEQGSPFTCTVANASGAVIADQEVTISDGVNGSQTARTDQNGKATFTVPNGWDSVRVAVLDAVASSIALKAIAHRGGQPVVNQAPTHIAPGQIVNLNGQDLGNLSTVTIGGQPAPVLGSSPNSITVAAPKNLPARACDVVVTNDSGVSSSPKSVQAINLHWDGGVPAIRPGQTISRTLTVGGTQDKVMLNIAHPSGDAAEVKGGGMVQSCGGPNNVVHVQLTGVRAGSYSLMATLPGALDPSTMDDRNAAASLLNANGYALASPSAQFLQRDLLSAERISRAAAQCWSKASAAGRTGHLSQARLRELAASLRDQAASEQAIGHSAAADSLQQKAAAAEGRAS